MGAGRAWPHQTGVWVKFEQFREIICHFQKYKAKVCRTNSSKVTTNCHLGPFFGKLWATGWIMLLLCLSRLYNVLVVLVWKTMCGVVCELELKKVQGCGSHINEATSISQKIIIFKDMGLAPSLWMLHSSSIYAKDSHIWVCILFSQKIWRLKVERSKEVHVS